MIPTLWQVVSALVALALGYVTVVLMLGLVGKVGVALGWWKERRPLNLPRR